MIDWAKEVTVNSSGRYMSIVKNSGTTLWLGYIAVFLQCPLNCLESKLINQVYYLGDTTTYKIPACVFSLSTTVGTLTSTGTPTAPSGFAIMTKNADNSYSIVLQSSDPSFTG